MSEGLKIFGVGGANSNVGGALSAPLVEIGELICQNLGGGRGRPPPPFPAPLNFWLRAGATDAKRGARELLFFPSD